MNRFNWKRISVVFLIAIALLFTAVIGFWMQAAMGPSALALAALQSDEQVTILQEDGLIIFEPALAEPSAGFILYPGAGVDHRSYSPILRQIAAQGYVAALPSMPLNLAFFKPNAANQAIDRYPEIENWIVGGHSLGGVVAANYVAKHPSVDGIVFMASYPANDALKNKDMPTLSIYGTQDGLTTREDIENSRKLLPKNTMYIEIDGGNHAQFGSYGAQDGDNNATISPQMQWSQIVDAVVGVLASISE